MSKGKLCIVLVGLSLLVLLAIIGFRIQRWTQSLVERAHERLLSVEEIRPVFLRITNCELPSKADNLRAIFEEGRDPRIFVRFDTDSEGVAYILKEFSGERVISKTFDADDIGVPKKSVSRFFTRLSFWQNELGVILFNPDSIESCHVLEYSGSRGYKILIDDQSRTVYIDAYHR